MLKAIMQLIGKKEGAEDNAEVSRFPFKSLRPKLTINKRDKSAKTPKKDPETRSAFSKAAIGAAVDTVRWNLEGKLLRMVSQIMVRRLQRIVREKQKSLAATQTLEAFKNPLDSPLARQARDAIKEAGKGVAAAAVKRFSAARTARHTKALEQRIVQEAANMSKLKKKKAQTK